MMVLVDTVRLFPDDTVHLAQASRGSNPLIEQESDPDTLETRSGGYAEGPHSETCFGAGLILYLTFWARATRAGLHP